MARSPIYTNRTRELRELAGLSMDELAERMGTSHQQVSKHELGQRRLTIQWLQRYAMALGVTPADIMAAPDLTDPQSEVEPATIDGMPQLSRIIATRGLTLFRVLKSRLTDIGIQVGAMLTVDATPTAVAAAKAGDVVVVRLSDTEILLLRQYLPPNMLVTHEPGNHNTLMRLDDRSIRLEIIGVVMRD